MITAADASAVLRAAEAAGVPAMILGLTGGDALTFAGESAAIDDLKEVFEAWLPGYMGAA